MCHKMHMQKNNMYVKQTSAQKLDNEITNNIAHIIVTHFIYYVTLIN